MVLEAPPNVDIAGWPAVIDVGEGFYFKPEGAGRILASPADETPSPPTDAAPDELDIAICIDRLQAAADIPVRRVIRAWAGLRTFAPDRTPVIGYDPKAPGLFWFAGQGGYGMQIAPAAARLGAALARGEGAPQDMSALGVNLAQLSPERFAVGGDR
jgi:D-arginine dehydrogenase